MKAAFKKISSSQSKDEDLSNGLVTDVPGVGAVLGGTYYPLDKIPKSLERQLDRDGLLFDTCADPVKSSANMCNSKQINARNGKRLSYVESGE